MIPLLPRSLCLLIAAAACLAAQHALRARGLEQVGNTWVLAEEIDLQARLAELERLEKPLADARQTVDQLIEQNQKNLAALADAQLAVPRLQAALAAARPGTVQWNVLNNQLNAQNKTVNQLQAQCIPRDKLGATAPLKPSLIELVEARNEVLLRVLPMRSLLDGLTNRYDVLGGDRAVKSALSVLGSQGTLGPSRKLLERWKVVDRLQSQVLTDALPLYREGHFYRVTAIVNERQPLTFSFLDTTQQPSTGNNEPIVIPQNLAEAAGLSIDKNAPRAILHTGPDRNLPLAETKISQLRFGRVVLRDVKAYILPPSGGDVGPRLGLGALAKYRVKLDPDRLMLTVGN